MITSDYGFFVDNYVGTYHILDHHGNAMLVSEEFHPARDGEKKLIKKRLFCDDFKTNRYLLLDLANIDISKDSEILDFCNKYGLPYSSAKINDQQPGYYIMGLECPETVYQSWDPYYRNDTMSIKEFCRHVSTAKRMMQIKYELENKDKNPLNMLQYLLPLLLYDRVDLYEFNDDDPERHTLTTSFQYYFLSVCHKRHPLNGKLAVDLFHFRREIHDISNKQNKVYINEELYRLLQNPYIQKLYDLIIAVCTLDTIALNQIEYDEFFNLKIPADLDISKELQQIMYDVAPFVLADSINELMQQVHPQMTPTENGEFDVDWNFNFQFEGFCMELLLMISSKNMLKKCKNPTCEKFFSPNEGHLDRIYCSHRCGSLVAKRRQRIKDRENPNRLREKPRFESRKKNK